MDTCKFWTVVGGADKGGILVRAARETTSAQEEERLSTGAVVWEVELAGERLCYVKLTGTGPGFGWVSVKLKDKELLTRTDAAFIADLPPPPTEEERSESRAAELQAAEESLATPNEAPLEPLPHPGLLPPAPRPSAKALPELQDFSEKIQERFKKKRKNTPYARMFCFYGIGDSAGQWMQFIEDGASWCEVIVYEAPAHGIRSEEPWATYAERIQDAWSNLRPAFEELAAGGAAHGAPFAFFCHSGGSVMVCNIAKRCREELGIEPCAFYMADQRPPDVPFVNETGYKLMVQDPLKYLQIWEPHVAHMYVAGGRTGFAKAIFDRWSAGLQMLQEYYDACPGVIHKFRCPIYVFVSNGEPPASAQDEDGEAAARPEEVPALERLRRHIFSTIAHPGTMREFEFWKHWTSSTCEVICVDATHPEIWYHMDTEIPTWRSFRALSKVDDVMPPPEHKSKGAVRRDGS